MIEVSMIQSFDLVFCGTPRFAVPTLERLVEAGFRVPLVITQPDRPKGRGLELGASPVKQSAEKLGIPIYQPEKIKQNEELRAKLEAIRPQAIIVVGYGRIIPPWMLELPPLGNINLHASLLPKYRGAAPVQWAVAKGETVTGVTTMRIDEGLDTGEILLQQELLISEQDTAETLAPKLAAIGADLMIETLRRLQAGTIQPQRQDDAHATLAPILKKEDGRIDFGRSAQEIWNRIKLAPEQVPQAELVVEEGRLFVGCGKHSAIELLELQPEGKKRMPAADFVRGYRPQTGEMLGVQS
jgi:methionyl-tRNA formyltransferase